MTTALAVLLSAGAAVGTSPEVVGPTPNVPSGTPPTIAMTTINWSGRASLLDPARPAWGHLAGSSASSDIEVKVVLNGLTLHESDIELSAPDAFTGPLQTHCIGDESVPPAELDCHFQVPVSGGANRIHARVTADGRVIATADGVLHGGALNWKAGYEVLDATGAWSAVARDQAVTVLATEQTALRYVIQNTGTIPMRLSNGCSSRSLAPGRSVTCPLRGVRPAQSLAGEYDTSLRLEDAVGATAAFDIRTGIRTFAGTFALDATTIAPHGVIVLSGSGLPTGSAFALQFRIDDEPVILGTSTTRSGITRLAFPLPSTSLGAAHLNVTHDGLTIASLPFRVSSTTPTPDAGPPFALILIPTAVLVAVLAAWRVRRRRRRAAADAAGPAGAPARESPESRPTDSYPGASPATPEHEDARPR
ncbi:MAG: hypothetical protein M3N46_06770 [Actinomycetota bacterium]|nr:hypothetical protein [Actinomycetota bacterium]